MNKNIITKLTHQVKNPNCPIDWVIGDELYNMCDKLNEIDGISDMKCDIKELYSDIMKRPDVLEFTLTYTTSEHDNTIEWIVLSCFSTVMEEFDELDNNESVMDRIICEEELYQGNHERFEEEL